MQDNIINILISPLKSRRDADIKGRVRRPCVRIPHKPKPRRGDNILANKMNIIAPSGLICGWELGTVSSNTAYYIFIPSGFNTNKLTAWGGENPPSDRRGLVTNKQS